MKIAILDDPEHPYVLVAGGAESPETDQEINTQELLQIVQQVRAAHTRAWGRGNTQRTHTFQITRTYESIAAAERALFEHPGEIPKEGDIRITFEPCDESSAFVTLSDAVVHATNARQIGRSIVWRYTITSGDAEFTQPT